MCTICPVLGDNRVQAERGYRDAQHCAGAPIRATATPPPSRQALAGDAPGRAARCVRRRGRAGAAAVSPRGTGEAAAGDVAMAALPQPRA